MLFRDKKIAVYCENHPKHTYTLCGQNLRVLVYSDVLPGNATNNLWVLDLHFRFIGPLPGGITVNYNTFNNA
jgi:hypothetical protein